MDIFFRVSAWDKIDKKLHLIHAKCHQLVNFLNWKTIFGRIRSWDQAVLKQRTLFLLKIAARCPFVAVFGGFLFDNKLPFWLLATGRFLVTVCLPTVQEQPKSIVPILVCSSTSNTCNNRSHNALEPDTCLSFESMWSSVIEEEQVGTCIVFWVQKLAPAWLVASN